VCACVSDAVHPAFRPLHARRTTPAAADRTHLRGTASILLCSFRVFVLSPAIKKGYPSGEKRPRFDRSADAIHYGLRVMYIIICVYVCVFMCVCACKRKKIKTINTLVLSDTFSPSRHDRGRVAHAIPDRPTDPQEPIILQTEVGPGDTVE